MEIKNGKLLRKKRKKRTWFEIIKERNLNYLIEFEKRKVGYKNVC